MVSLVCSSVLVVVAVARGWHGYGRAHARGGCGFGGTNCQAMLSAHGASRDSNPAALRRWPAELFVFCGQDAADAHEQMRRLRKFLDQSTAPLVLRDLAFTASGLGTG